MAAAAEYADSQEHWLRPGDPSASYPIALWEPDEVVGHALELTGFDLLSRREAVTDGTTILLGTLLVDPLRRWLFPLASVSDRELRGLSADEVAAMEAGARYLGTWARQSGGGMARNTVAAQLDDLSTRLKSVRSGLLRDRAFLVGAQLVRLAASLAWDADSPSMAQRYYVLAVEMARVTDTEARLRAFLFTREAWAFAQLNHPRDFRRAVAHAAELFDESNAASCPTWLTGVEQGCFAARQAVEINNGALQGRQKRKLQDFWRELAPYQKTTAGRDFTEYLHDLPY